MVRHDVPGPNPGLGVPSHIAKQYALNYKFAKYLVRSYLHYTGCTWRRGEQGKDRISNWWGDVAVPAGRSSITSQFTSRGVVSNSAFLSEARREFREAQRKASDDWPSFYGLLSLIYSWRRGISECTHIMNMAAKELPTDSHTSIQFSFSSQAYLKGVS